MPWAMLCSGIQAKSSMRVTALNAAITSTPKAFTCPWMSTLPIGCTACCKADTPPYCSVRPSRLRSTRHWPRRGQSSGVLVHSHHPANTALNASAITVVMAEHTMPKPSPPIKIRSSAAFKMADTIKKRSGVRASPTLLNPAANAL